MLDRWTGRVAKMIVVSHVVPLERLVQGRGFVPLASEDMFSSISNSAQEVRS